VVTFGLGARKAVDRIEIIWPSGAVQVIDSPAIRQVHRIVEAVRAEWSQ
jgi:hypothetical protein